MEAASIPSGGEQGGEAAGGAPQVDLSPVLDRVGELGNQLNQVVERVGTLDSRLAPQEPAAEYDDGDTFDPALLGFEGDDMDPAQTMEAFNRLIDTRAGSLADQRVQAALAPVLEQVSDITTQNEMAAFAAEFPDYAADPARFDTLVQSAVEQLQGMGVPDEMAANLITKSSFLGMIARSTQGSEAGRQETPAGDVRERQLEPAGGANPGAGGEPNLARSIVAARQGNSLWGM